MNRSSVRRLAAACVLGVLAVAGAGCGETLCQRAQRTNRDLVTKSSRAGCTNPGTPFVEENCGSIESSCSEADRRIFEDVFDCLDGIQCDPSRESRYEDDYRACIGPLDNLSQDCDLASPFR